MLWTNQGDGSFLDLSRETGTCDSDWGWAGHFADFDNDGWEDIYTVNGLRSRGEENYIPLLLEAILTPELDFSSLDSYPDIGERTCAAAGTHAAAHALAALAAPAAPAPAIGAHLLHRLAGLVLGDGAVAVQVHLIEAFIVAGLEFVLGDLAVAVGVVAIEHHRAAAAAAAAAVTRTLGENRCRREQTEAQRPDDGSADKCLAFHNRLSFDWGARYGLRP